MKPKETDGGPKWRDPTWKVRRALGHKVVQSKKAYKRKRKHKELDHE